MNKSPTHVPAAIFFVVVRTSPDGPGMVASVLDRATELTWSRQKMAWWRATACVSKLEEEPAATREYLQSTIQEIEAANEELQSANEEILSSNEELTRVNADLLNLLASVQTAIVIVARDLRVWKNKGGPRRIRPAFTDD